MAAAHRRTLTGRAAVAVLLWFGFWLLGAALVGLLAWIPIVQLEHEKGGLDFAGIAAGVGSLVLLWTLRPRWWFRKKPIDGRPGLSREEFPLLHELVAEVAGKCGAPRADEIQLCDLSTAFIRAERSWFWQRRRHVVGIGLPLFAFLSRAELAAVLAHEFGHQRGGDLLLSPWVYRTRSSLASVLDSLSDSSFFLDVPFRAYGSLFLKASASVSREQELSADAHSAATYGQRAAFSALRKVRDLGTLWDVYFESDAVPLIQLGVRVPLLEGFRRFVAEDDKRGELPELIRSSRSHAPSAWDTHPPVEQRLRELDPERAQSEGTAEARLEAGDSSLELLGGEQTAEDAWYSRAVRGKPKPVRWEDVAESVLLPALRDSMVGTPLDPSGLSDLARLPALLAEADALWSRLQPTGDGFLSPQAKRVRVQRRLSDWLTLVVSNLGFSAELRPGAALVLRRGELSVQPRALVRQLVAGELDEARYRALTIGWQLDPVKPSP